VLKQAALRPQHPLLLVRPCTFWLLRLQLLQVLLQAVDAALALRGLAGKCLAWPFRPLAHDRRCAWARGCGNMRRGPWRHGRTLRRSRRPMEFWPRRRHMRCGPRRRCGDVRRRMRRHGRALRHGWGMECRRGGTRHGWRCRWACHCRWWSWPSCRRCGGPWWSTPSVSLPESLGGRADARRQHRDTNQKSSHANATRKHDGGSQLEIAHNFQRTGGAMVRPRPALRSSAAGSFKRNPASGSRRNARVPSRPGRW
jgi:hypothetical protein